MVSMGIFNLLANNLLAYFQHGHQLPANTPPLFVAAANTMAATFINCQPNNSSTWKDASFQLAKASFPFLGQAELQQLWGGFVASPCFAKLQPQQQDWLALLKALADRHYDKVSGIAAWLLQNDIADSDQQRYFLADMALLGYAIHTQKQTAEKFWKQFGQQLGTDYPRRINARILLARLNLISPQTP